MWLLLAGAAALVALVGAYVIWHYVLPHSVNVDRYRYPIAGIDVSKHNGDIDYESLLPELQALGYDGALSLEPEVGPKETAESIRWMYDRFR